MRKGDLLLGQMLIDKVAKYLSTKKQVRFAYLFGSHAKNRSGKLSDIDIAVYLNGKIGEYKRFDIRLELIGKLCALLKRNDVDLVILNDVPISLSSRIVHDGKIIFCRDELSRIRFETKVMCMFFDRKYYYDRHAKLSLATIAKQGIL